MCYKGTLWAEPPKNSPFNREISFDGDGLMANHFTLRLQISDELIRLVFLPDMIFIFPHTMQQHSSELFIL